jgi:hypothetical protein
MKNRAFRSPETDKELADELLSVAGHELEYHPTASALVAEAARRLLEKGEVRKSIDATSTGVYSK